MMADPEFQRITGAMQPKGRGVLQKAQGVNLAPAVQHWGVDPLDQYPTTGSARADESETILGGMDGAGNITTTWAGTMTLDHAPGGAPVEISINHAAGTYTLFLSGARFGVEMNDCGVAPTGPCNPGDRPNTKTIPLLGNQPPKGKDWASTLTVTGPLPAGGSASGKLAFVTNLGIWTDPTENIPLQKTIEWSFTPGS